MAQARRFLPLQRIFVRNCANLHYQMEQFLGRDVQEKPHMRNGSDPGKRSVPISLRPADSQERYILPKLIELI